jgi:hypothetical protein
MQVVAYRNHPGGSDTWQLGHALMSVLPPQTRHRGGFV